ncbi:MAG: ribosome maturation factor RimM [Oscillospiraceae bacterium]|nr:ribosome maturation factor RimM [Oscillospiraceae bacterium]
MTKDYLEAGKIVNTHGVRGEVKIQPWADSPAFLQDFDTLYIDGKPVKLISSRIHKQSLIAVLENVTDIDAAIAMKNKMVYIRRADAKLPPGHFFIQDILGLSVIDEAGTPIGALKEVLPLPRGEVYVIAKADGTGAHMVPNHPEFILEKNLDKGFIRVRLIEGM